MYCWEEETHNFNDSSNIWNNYEPWKWQKLKCGVASYNFGLSTLYDIKKQKDQLWLLSSGSVKGLFKRQTLKQPKVAKLGKVF